MQIRLPVACLLIVATSFWYYSRKKNLRTMTSKVFELMVFVAMLHLLAVTVTEYTVNNRDKVPEAFNYFWHVIYFVSITSTVALLLFYLLVYIERGTRKSQRGDKIVISSVWLAGIVTQITLPIEYIDTPNGSYSYGPKAFSLYVVVVYTLFTMIYKLLFYRKSLMKRNVFALACTIFLITLVAAVQIFFPHLLLTDLAIALVVLSIMINVEDAHMFVSHKTGLYNELGCREIIQENILAGQPFRAGVYVFLGDSDAITKAMLFLEEELSAKKSVCMCGTMADNQLVVLPLSKLSGVPPLPDPLPMPESGDGGLQYLASTLEFTGKETVEQIEDAIRECKNQYEEESLHTDELTGLLRREAYIRQVNYMIAQEMPFTLLMTDLDDFKSINDTYGHSVGDDALKFAADAFRAVLRSSDVICRMGGDEFSIVLAGVVEKDLILEIMGRIRRKLGSADVLPEGGGKISISVGAKIHLPEEGTLSFQELYTEADNALYRAKNSGKDRISFSN